MLPALADVDQLENRLGAPPDDQGQAEALLLYASTLVREHTGQAWEDPEDVPDAAVLVTVEMVARASTNPAGVTQEQAGPYSRSFGPDAQHRIYLSAADKAMLARHRVSPLWSAGVSRGDLETPAVVDTGEETLEELLDS